MTANEATVQPKAPIIAHITLDGAAKAIELYKKAFGAEERFRLSSPDGSKIMHACIGIGDSNIFLADPMPGCGGLTQNLTFYVSVPDADKAFQQAKSAGLEVSQEPQEAFWGDRYGSLKDAWGISWMLAHKVREVSKEEMEKAVEQMGKAA